eukprot:EG_transcript_1386
MPRLIHRCLLFGVVSIAVCCGHRDEAAAQRVPSGWSHFGMPVDRETSMVSLEMEFSERNRYILTVRGWLHGVGATHVRLTPDHRRVSFQVRAAQAERSFAVLLSTFQNDQSGTITLGTLDEFKVPAPLQPYVTRARLAAFPSPHWRAAAPLSRQPLLDDDGGADLSSYELLFWLPPCTIVMLAVAYILHTLHSLGLHFRVPATATRKVDPAPSQVERPPAEVPKKPNPRPTQRKRAKEPPPPPPPRRPGRLPAPPKKEPPVKEAVAERRLDREWERQQDRERERSDEEAEEAMGQEEVEGAREDVAAEVAAEAVPENAVARTESPPLLPDLEADVCAKEDSLDPQQEGPPSPSSQSSTASGEAQRRESGRKVAPADPQPQPQVAHPRRPSGEQESKDCGRAKAPGAAEAEAKARRPQPSPKGRGGGGAWQVVGERGGGRRRSAHPGDSAAAAAVSPKAPPKVNPAKDPPRKATDTSPPAPKVFTAAAANPLPARRGKQSTSPRLPLKAELLCSEEPDFQPKTSSPIINAGATPPAGNAPKLGDTVWPSSAVSSSSSSSSESSPTHKEAKSVQPGTWKKGTAPSAVRTEAGPSGNRGRARGCWVLEQQEWPLPGEKGICRDSHDAPAATPALADSGSVRLEARKSWYDLMEEELSEGLDPEASTVASWAEDPCRPAPAPALPAGPVAGAVVLQYGWTVWSAWTGAPGHAACLVKLGSFGTLDGFRAMWHRLPPLEDGCTLQFFRRDVSPNAGDHQEAPRWVANNLPVECREPLWCRTVAAVVLGHYLEPEGTEPITAVLLTACWDGDRAEFWMSSGTGGGSALTQAAAYRSMANLHGLLFPEEGPAHLVDPPYPSPYPPPPSSTKGLYPSVEHCDPYGQPCQCPACLPPAPPYPAAGRGHPPPAPLYSDDPMAYPVYPALPYTALARHGGVPPSPAPALVSSSASAWYEADSAAPECSATHHPAPPVTCYVHNPYAPIPQSSQQ